MEKAQQDVGVGCVEEGKRPGRPSCFRSSLRDMHPGLKYRYIPRDSAFCCAPQPPFTEASGSIWKETSQVLQDSQDRGLGMTGAYQGTPELERSQNNLRNDGAGLGQDMEVQRVRRLA